MDTMPIWLPPLWLAVWSLILYLTMGADKRFAKTGRRRVPEARLFLLAVLGGAVGGLGGIYRFRHKTKHWYFVVGFWALAVLQLAGLAAWYLLALPRLAG